MYTHICAGAEETLRLWRESRRRLVKRHAGQSSLHSWRVCTRRLLALEALLAPRAARAAAGGFVATLDCAFHAAGRLRDTQVAIQQLKTLERRFPEAGRLARHLRHTAAGQRKKATRRVRSLSYQRLRKNMKSWSLPTSAHEAQVASVRACRRLASAESRLIALIRIQPTPRQLHASRIQLKLIRYMMELCQDMRIGAQPRWPSLTILRLQDALGEVTDVTVLQHIVDKFASRHDHWRARAKSLRRYLDRHHAGLRNHALHMTAKVTKSTRS
jgi:CHAD domain-containing protein